MKRLTLAIIAAAVFTTIGVTANAADHPKAAGELQREKRDVDRHAADLNRLDDSHKKRAVGLKAVAQETGVSMGKLEAQIKEYPAVGVAGLLVANHIATHGKGNVDELLKARAQGRTWSQIAQHHKVNLEDLDNKMDRVEAVMRAAK